MENEKKIKEGKAKTNKRKKNNKEGKKLLRRFTEKLPRKPWEYTFRQKIRNGWLSQGIWNAKKSWKEVIE